MQVTVSNRLAIGAEDAQDAKGTWAKVTCSPGRFQKDLRNWATR